MKITEELYIKNSTVLIPVEAGFTRVVVQNKGANDIIVSNDGSTEGFTIKGYSDFEFNIETKPLYIRSTGELGSTYVLGYN